MCGVRGNFGLKLFGGKGDRELVMIRLVFIYRVDRVKKYSENTEDGF